MTYRAWEPNAIGSMVPAFGGGSGGSPTPAGGSVVPIRGAVGWSTNAYYWLNSTAIAQGDPNGFEITVVAIVRDQRQGVSTRVLAATADVTFGTQGGYAVSIGNVRPNGTLWTAAPTALSPSFGIRWIDQYQAYTLNVWSYYYAAGAWRVHLNGKEIFTAATGGFPYLPSQAVPSPIPLVMGASRNAAGVASSPATDCFIHGIGYKTGTLTQAERDEVMESILTAGVLPDVSYTHKWTFEGATLGAAVDLSDSIGGGPTFRVTGAGLEVIDLYPLGRPAIGTEQTYATTSEAGFITLAADLGGTGTAPLLARVPLTFQGEVTGVAPTVIGAVYLTSGRTLQATARALLGVVGAGIATLRMVRQSTGVVIATWTSAAALADVALGAPAAIPADDWYTFDLAGDVPATVTRCYGARLEF